MSKKRHKDHAAKREAGGFVAFPHVVLRSSELAALSPRATKLLCDLLSQYKGDNNGDLCAAMTLMKSRGWKGAATISRAVAELRDTDFIVTTRAGGRHRAALYAISFFAIDWCGGKLEINAPSRVHMGAWRRKGAISSGPLVEHPKGDCSTGGAIQPTTRPNSPPQEQSGRIRARPCSTHGHLSRDTTTSSAVQEQGKSEIARGNTAGSPKVDTIDSTTATGGQISPQAAFQAAPPASLELQDLPRAQYQEILQRVCKRADKRHPKRVDRPSWEFLTELVAENHPRDFKWVCAHIGRLAKKVDCWPLFRRAKNECVSKGLYGLGAQEFLDRYPFMPPEADHGDAPNVAVVSSGQSAVAAVAYRAEGTG